MQMDGCEVGKSDGFELHDSEVFGKDAITGHRFHHALKRGLPGLQTDR